MSTLRSTLLIHQLALEIHLGCSENERLAVQTIYLDAHIQLPQPPKACLTDNIDDTICYDVLINRIREYIANKSFKLIERLAYEIYQLVKPGLPPDSKLTISITKQPAIKALGHAQFRYGDA